MRPEQTDGALEKMGKSAEGAGSRFSGLCDAVKGGALMEAADQLDVVGGKIQQLGGAAVDVFQEANGASVKAAAYFGETGAAAEATADTIKKCVRRRRGRKYGCGVQCGCYSQEKHPGTR